MNQNEIKSLEGLLDRIPPSNNDAEASLLGAILIDNKQIEKVKNIIQPEDFYNDQHKLIYRAYIFLHNAGDPIDIITLTNFLRESSTLEYVGGVTRISELATEVASIQNIESYAKIIKQKSVLRGIILLGSKLNSGGRRDINPKEILEQVQGGLDLLATEYSKIYANDDGTDRLYQYHELVEKTREFINKSKIPTFFNSIDEMLGGGFQGGELAILSGKTKEGKTTICQTWSYLQAQNNIPSIWFSFEMSWQELTKKFMMMDDEGEIEGTPTKLPIYYPIENKNLSLEWLEQKIKHGIKKYGAKIVYIDHLHFLLSLKETASANVSLILGGIVRELKRISVRNDIPIIMVAHIKKMEVEDEPNLSSVRDSGLIVQESDFTFLIWRERIKKERNGKYNVETVNQDEIYTNMATLALEANRRNGITKKIKIGMLNGRFYEAEEYERLRLGTLAITANDLTDNDITKSYEKNESD